MNLLTETMHDLAERGKTPSDVRWVGSANFGWFTWDDFAALADTEYDAGFGGQNVPDDMKVVGDDWWLERHEYDGSEWWEFKVLPVKPETHRMPDAVIGDESLRELHGERLWGWSD